MSRKPYPSKEQILSELVYEESSGVFYRKNPDNRTNDRGIAGYKKSNGYITISLNNTAYYAHRLAWVVTYGYNPDSILDHINRDRSDNRIGNLRLATKSSNALNTGLRKDNSIGFKGVYWHKKAGKWIVEGKLRGKAHYLGLYGCLLDAICVRINFENIHYGYKR